MRAVIQRVRTAKVEVEDLIAGQIDGGLLVLLGVAKTDTRRDADYLAGKIAGLRIFPDEAGRMNKSVIEVGGCLLVVSQFTLYGDVSRGRRPGFERAADAPLAQGLYQYFIEAVRAQGIRVETGVFQTDMSVHLVNDGPVTIIIDSDKLT